MSFLLHFLAHVATCWEWMRRTFNTLRVRVLVPNIIHTGHDMILTQAGYWTPFHGPRIGIHDTPVIYDAVTHRVRVSIAPLAWTRWRWIGAVGSTGADYGNFFADLRVERGQELTLAQIIALAVHQTGRWPGATLRVTTRTGEESEVLVITGEPAVVAPPAATGEGEPRYPELDYIR